MRATINNAATATQTQGSAEPARKKAMAERVGFEPTNTREDVTGIPVQRLRPLGHLSNQALATIFSKASSLRRHRKAANDTPSRLRRRLLWHIERRRCVEALVALFSARRRRRIQRWDVQSIGGVRRIQPGRNLQGSDAGRLHVRLGVVARPAHVSQVLATRETHEGHHNSDQHESIPHLSLPFHGLRPGFNGVREARTPSE
jgi:hypothetical protein